jgi:hypothetical protein
VFTVITALLFVLFIVLIVAASFSDDYKKGDTVPMNLDSRWVPIEATLRGYTKINDSWVAVYEVLMADGETRWTTLLSDGSQTLFVDEQIEIMQTQKPQSFSSQTVWEKRKH